MKDIKIHIKQDDQSDPKPETEKNGQKLIILLKSFAHFF